MRCPPACSHRSGAVSLPHSESGNHLTTWLTPKPLTTKSNADGHFDKRDFVYVAADDEYRCAAGQRLSNSLDQLNHAQQLRVTRQELF